MAKPKHFRPVKHCMYCAFCDEKIGDESIHETYAYCSEHNFVISRCNRYYCDNPHDSVCDDWKEQNEGAYNEMKEDCDKKEDIEENIISIYMKNIRSIYKKGKKFIIG